MSASKLFHILAPLYLNKFMPRVTVLHLGCCTGLGFPEETFMFKVLKRCKCVGFKPFIYFKRLVAMYHNLVVYTVLWFPLDNSFSYDNVQSLCTNYKASF